MNNMFRFIKISLALGVFSVASLAYANSYTIDAVHSAVIFKVQHFGAGYTYGISNDISGEFTLDDKNAKNSKVSLTLKAASLDTKDEKRNQHLKSPDFFNAAQFPEIKFVSTGVAKEGNGYRISGNLTMRGVSKPVSVLMNVVGKGKNPQNQKELIGLEGTLTIKRSQYGVNFMSGLLGEDVILTIAVEGVKK